MCFRYLLSIDISFVLIFNVNFDHVLYNVNIPLHYFLEIFLGES